MSQAQPGSWGQALRNFEVKEHLGAGAQVAYQFAYWLYQ
jgi:hypothetical protein